MHLVHGFFSGVCCTSWRILEGFVASLRMPIKLLLVRAECCIFHASRPFGECDEEDSDSECRPDSGPGPDPDPDDDDKQPRDSGT